MCPVARRFFLKISKAISEAFNNVSNEALIESLASIDTNPSIQIWIVNLLNCRIVVAKDRFFDHVSKRQQRYTTRRRALSSTVVSGSKQDLI